MTLLEKRARDDPRRRETELAFLRATEDLLAEGASFADLNVSRIAERAGRTRTAFYAHFDDRRELLVRLVDDFSAEVYATTDQFWTGPVDRAAVEGVIVGLLGTFRSHATLLRAVVEASGYDREIREFWNDGVVGRFRTAAEDRLRRDGRPPQEARALALALVWMTERTGYQQVVGETGVPDRAVVAALTEVWTSALRTGD